ncbi:MAG TPA: phosphoenolpyruvate--protein phosphotransferase [Spirochaetia bacterium]|nr:phosphoenolpyruvate--protein phosphotransferase [Spirochaetia bacterium]
MEYDAKLEDVRRKLQALYDSQTSAENFLAKVLDLVSKSTLADSCSLYLYDTELELLLLKATGGPNPDTGAPAQVAKSEGIIGSAVTEARTIRASSAGAGYGSEMVVPLRRGPRRLGAVVLKHKRSDFFSETTEQDIRALFAQLGATIQNTSYLAPFQRPDNRPAPEASYLIQGQTASRGVASGFALPWETGFGDESEDPTDDPTPEAAVARFEASLEITHRQIELIHKDSESALYDVVSLIFGAHLLMLTDDAFSGEMRRLIQGGSTPSAAVRQVVNQYADALSAIPDTRMAEKAQDVRDLGHRLIRNLIDPSAESFDYRNAIVIAHSIYPSELVTLVAQNVAGIVFSGSGVTAHIAILARSLSVPVLITQDQRLFQLAERTPLLLDASKGILHVNPKEERPAGKAGKRAPSGAGRNGKDHTATTIQSADQPPVDPAEAAAAGERHSVKILANLNLYSDAKLAAKNHASGVGLYRSEFPFIIRNDFLSEEEQLFIYRRIIEPFSGREITFRTADIGGDKLFENTGPREQNPFLGVRGIRFSLANREMFRDQLKAMLRAGVGEDLRVMFPMVSSVDEILEAKEEVERATTSLRNDGLPHNENPKIGAMIELPSAVEAIEDFAQVTDFLSIGTNDLVMYLLAVDRTNERLSELYRSYHPTVLRVLQRIVAGVGDKVDELSVCGDSAGDPLMIPFYLGIGVRKLSLHPGELPRIYSTLNGLSPERAREISGEMLSIRRTSEMEKYLGMVHSDGGLRI